MKRLPFPWRELIGAVCIVATLILSHFFPWGFAPEPERPIAQPVPQEPTAEAVAPYMDTPRAKGARPGVQNLQLRIDTSARRTDRGGLI